MPDVLQPPKPNSSQTSNIEPAHTISRKWLITAVLVALLLIVVIISALVFIFAKNVKNGTTPPTALKNRASISGNFNINGVIPDGATINIGAKKIDNDKFAMIATGIPAVDGGSWHWHQAENGVEYQMQAYLIDEGNVIGESSVLTLVAPADSEVFGINSTANPPQAANGTISGIVDLNGYVPPGSSISIAVQAAGQTSYTTVVSGINATDGIAWSWTEAQSGISYAIKAMLVLGGNTLSSSSALSVTAPAGNEVLVINSTASSPSSAQVSVSGTINLNGVIPQGSTIAVASRPTGSTAFTIFTSNLAATDGISWSFTNAQSGQSYDFQAYLQNNGGTTATSQTLTVAAPATGETLSLNIQQQPAAPPSNSINYVCNGQNPQTNNWQTTIGYNNNSPIQNAQQYWVTIGTSQGGNNMYNVIQTPNNPNQSQTVQTGYILSTGQNYYAQYAYSSCSNCSSFSQFSQSIQIVCAATPTPTPTSSPTPSNTPTSTPTSAPTNAPTNTPTNPPTPTN